MSYVGFSIHFIAQWRLAPPRRILCLVSCLSCARVDPTRVISPCAIQFETIYNKGIPMVLNLFLWFGNKPPGPSHSRAIRVSDILVPKCPVTVVLYSIHIEVKRIKKIQKIQPEMNRGDWDNSNGVKQLKIGPLLRK